ncbi:hypothetical protein JR316_0005581 [Psilocybe cubensis]|uniref:Uncharacterized protein n=1 Tax=Psilocybe cubensis TaxID=181762 RepID=A0ACB8H0A1_PSICU|nr:hypothetical protein JR316_0005581 [Psilocybe cubensis]KAH9481062.1 hypothetical protein JR316_0005581 [Psilocybe cubensis]
MDREHLLCKIGSKRERSTTVMITVSSVMFFIATFHVMLGAIRLVHGFSDELFTIAGPASYIGDLRSWKHVLQDALYATQVNLGSAALVLDYVESGLEDHSISDNDASDQYCNIAVGYILCGTYPSVDPSASIFNGHITQWIKALYSIAVVLNSITTGLLVYRIWTTYKESPSYRLGDRKTVPIARLLIDSGALQLPCEIIVLILYVTKMNAQYIMLECITPIVMLSKAITFNAITIRLKMHSASMDVIPLPNNHIRTAGGTVRPVARTFQVSVITEGDEENLDAYQMEAKSKEGSS